MKLIIGLGNPGKKYEKTRHNAGFMATDHIAEAFGFDGFKEIIKFNTEIAEGNIAGEKVLIAKPQTYMNLSGLSVILVMRFYKIKPRDVIVIHDDADIPAGKLRIRPAGRAGGHNGVKSIIEALGTEKFTRIRLGIASAEPFKGELEDYVLGKMTAKERGLMEENIQKLPDALTVLLKSGAEEAMGRFN